MRIAPRIKVVGLAIAAIAMLQIAPSFAADGSSDLPEVVAKRLELIDLLKAQKFDALESRVAAMFLEAKDGSLAPWDKRSLMYAFSRADPALAGALAQWREAYPKSFAPHLAFGLYSFAIGGTMRGEKYAYLTNHKRFEEMGTYFDAADKELRRAVQLRPKLEIAWVALINLAKVTGKRIEMVSRLNEAISHLPNHAFVYRTYFRAIAPKWGGSFKQRLALKIRIMADYPADPDFVWLDDEEDIEAAWQLYWHREYPKALVKFKELISARDTATVRRGYAWSLISTRKQKEGIAELERVRTMSPADSDSYTDLAEMQVLHPEMWEEARRNLNIAVMLEPYDPQILVQRAHFLINDGKLASAKRYLDRALFFGAYDDAVRDGLRTYYRAIGDLDAAIEEAEKMVTLVPGNLRNHYLYGITLYEGKDCRSGQVLQNYLDACRISRQCQEHEMGAAKMVIQSVKFSCN